MEDSSRGEGMFNQLLIFILVIVAVILAFFVFFKIAAVKDIILGFFG